LGKEAIQLLTTSLRSIPKHLRGKAKEAAEELIQKVCCSESKPVRASCIFEPQKKADIDKLIKDVLNK